MRPSRTPQHLVGQIESPARLPQRPNLPGLSPRRAYRVVVVEQAVATADTAGSCRPGRPTSTSNSTRGSIFCGTGDQHNEHIAVSDVEDANRQAKRS